MAESKITFIVEAAQATAAARALSGELDGIGKAAKTSAAGATTALSGVEKAIASTGASSVSADPKIQALFASLNTMKTELAALPATATAAAGAVSATAAASSTAALGFGAFAGAIAFGLPQIVALIGVLIEMATAKEKLITIDKEQFELDLRRNVLTERTTRIHADLVTAFRLLASQQKEYQLNTAKLNFDLEKLAQGSETRLVIDQKTGVAQQQLFRSTTDLARGVAELNEKLGEQEKILQPALEVILQHKLATGQSTEETLKWAEAVGHFGGEAIDFFRQRLNALIPDIDDFTKKINALKAARPDVGSSLPGIGALQSAVEATFQLARDQGITDWAEQVKFATPALKALDEALKQHAGTLKGYRAELAAQEPGMRSAIELMKEQQRILTEEFAARKKVRDLRDIGPQLEIEALKALSSIRQDDLQLRIEIIQKEFDLKRATLSKDRVLTQEHLDALEIMQNVATIKAHNDVTKLVDARSKAFVDERVKQALEWEKSFEAWQAHLAKMAEAERRFQETLEAERLERDKRILADAVRRAKVQGDAERADARARENKELERTVQLFGRLSENAALAAQQIQVANGALRGQQAVLVVLNSSLEQFTQDWLRSGQIFQFVADGISDALRGMVANGEDFGQNMKAVFLELIAQLATYWGRLFISMGAGMIVFSPFQGAALIAAGVALLALAGVFSGLADRARQSAQPAGAAAAAGGASDGGGAAGGGGGNNGPPNNVIPFPTSGINSGGTTSINIRLQGSDVDKFLKGRMVSAMGESGGSVQRAVQKAARKVA